MTDKQKLFCDEYIANKCNGTLAYKKAYPNIKNDMVAGSAANRLLKNVEVKTYISERLEELHDERTADAKEVIEYLTSVLRGQSKAEVVVVEGTGEGCSEARLMDKTPDEKERLKAAELLGKYYALFTERTQAEGGVVQIINNIPRSDDNDRAD
ncbi:MAG: terminase small subunit [Clostridia bacterium]|jgi:phage terminase small subunit|nr:terminase small subunit [Clostridia bacterium]